MNSKFHGIIVQMPLDSSNKINSHLITDSVSSEKDVDGLNTINEGKIAVGDLSGLLPCTPNGVLELIKRTGLTIAGKEAVVLGRSRIVGTPCAELLKWNHATVTVCHSKTENLKDVCARADILVVAIGQPEMVRADWVKKGAVIIDCGINAINGESHLRMFRNLDWINSSRLPSERIFPLSQLAPRKILFSPSSSKNTKIFISEKSSFHVIYMRSYVKTFYTLIKKYQQQK